MSSQCARVRPMRKRRWRSPSCPTVLSKVDWVRCGACAAPSRMAAKRVRQVGSDFVVSAQRERRIGRIDPDPAVAERIEISRDVPRLRLGDALGRHARPRLERHGIHQPGDQVARRVRQESCKEMLLGVALEARADLASGPSDALDDMTGAAAIGLNEPMPALGIAAGYRAGSRPDPALRRRRTVP